MKNKNKNHYSYNHYNYKSSKELDADIEAALRVIEKYQSDYPFFDKQNLEEGINTFLRRVYLLTPKTASEEEAQSRSAWKDQIVFILRGAAKEFYKCRLHDRISASHNDRNHWELEWRFHLGERLLEQLSRTTTFKDKEKAAAEAFAEYMKVNNSERVSAANTIAKYISGNSNKLQKILTDKDVKDFYVEVRDAMNKHFATMAEEGFVFENGSDKYPKMKVLEVEKKKRKK